MALQACHMNKPRTAEYRAWQNMKTRCYNLNYKTYHRYGGRGIFVDPAFSTFEGFIQHIGPRPSPLHQLDRIDNDKNYEPGNVRWADRVVNANNKSTTKKLTIDGTTEGLPYWERASGRSRKVIWRRIHDGWPSSWAVFLPPLPHSYRVIANGLHAWAKENGL